MVSNIANKLHLAYHFVMDTSEKLRIYLANRGYKVTQVRTRIYQTLTEATQPLTTSELIRQLADMDKVSVYRTIALFEAIGIVHRIWNGFKSSVELSEEFSPHHHHFTCTDCGMIVSFKSEGIEHSLHQLEQQLDMTITRHLVELRGLCAKCRPATKPQ